MRHIIANTTTPPATPPAIAATLLDSSLEVTGILLLPGADALWTVAEGVAKAVILEASSWVVVGRVEGAEILEALAEIGEAVTSEASSRVYKNLCPEDTELALIYRSSTFRLTLNEPPSSRPKYVNGVTSVW